MIESSLEAQTTAQWSAWMKTRDMVALAKAMGWGECVLQSLHGEEVLRAWGLDAVVGTQARVFALGEVGSVQLMVVEGVATREGVLRLIDQARKRRPNTCRCWWWSTPTHLTMITHAPQRVHLSVAWENTQPDIMTQFIRLGWEDVMWEGCLDETQAWQRHVRGVLDHSTLTQTFFKSFVRAHRTLAKEVRGASLDVESCEHMALHALLRVLVMYFLQGRGALNRDTRFVWRQLQRAHEQGICFQTNVLNPLCFGALNKEAHARAKEAQALGDFPFLNGGLFEPSPLEVEHPNAHWSTETWREVLERAFEPYRFVLFDQDSGHQAIDPEMLGRVFEGLMGQGTRRKTGAFYTPRHIVRDMVQRAITRHLATQTGISPAHLNALVGRGDATMLTPHQRARVDEALAHLTLLDPAVGTGAFLIEALHLRTRLHSALTGERASFALMKEWIHRHFYGVDVNATAVRLCEVRLWLALLASLPQDLDLIAHMTPLPNLGHRIVHGDSLTGLLGHLSVCVDVEAAGAWCVADARLRHDIDALRRLQRAHLDAHGRIKRAIRRAVKRRELGLTQRMIAMRRLRLSTQHDALETIAQSCDMFGQPRALDRAQEKAMRVLRSHLTQLDNMDDQLRTHGLPTMGFEYGTHFADVMAQGGFDIIVTNPPWVRAHDQPPSQRKMFQALYKSASGKLWAHAKEQGISKKFGAQVDVSALFIERAMGLLKPRGVCAALVPSKLMRSLHGAALRDLLSAHDIWYIEDMSERDHRMFDAATYPTILCVQQVTAPSKNEVRRAPRRVQSVEVVSWQGKEAARWQQPSSGLNAAPWMLTQSEPSATWARPSTTLGAWRALRPRRGIMTGRNSVFVYDPRDHTDQQWRASCSRTILGGRDISEFTVHPTKKVLWPYDAHGRILQTLDPDANAYFETHRAALERRADHNTCAPLWQMFRVHESMIGPKVVWRDMGPQMEACAVDASTLVLNTAYYIPCADDVRAWALSVFLNHPHTRAFCKVLAERARGGWRRHFAWTLCMAPIPDVFAQWLTDTTPHPTWDAMWSAWMSASDHDAALMCMGRLFSEDADPLVHEEVRHVRFL